MLDRLAIPVHALVALPSTVLLVVHSSVTNGLNPCEYEQQETRERDTPVKFVAVRVCEANYRTTIIITVCQLCSYLISVTFCSLPFSGGRTDRDGMRDGSGNVAEVVSVFFTVSFRVENLRVSRKRFSNHVTIRKLMCSSCCICRLY